MAATTQDPTQTDFYKHATGQEDDAVRQQQAERMKREAYEDFSREWLRTGKGLEVKDAVDTKQVVKDWKANPARATIKYDTRNIYKGVLGRIAVYDNTVNMIIDPDTQSEVVVTLYRLQPVAGMQNGKAVLADVVPQMQFTARYDPGQRFYFYCPKAASLFGKVHLLECIAVEEKLAEAP